MWRGVLIGLVVGGCAKHRDPAPMDLDSGVRATYRGFEGPLIGTEHLGAIASWLVSDENLELGWEGLAMTNLSEDEVAGLPVPDGTDLANHRGVATAFRSEFPPIDHAALAAGPDQTWTDPGSFLVYDRTIVAGDAEAFVQGSGDIRTDNQILKAGAFGVQIPYRLRRDYRWVALADGDQALISRWWLEEQGCSDSGKNCVLQSFGLDLLIPTASGADRLVVNWVEVVTEADAFLTEDARIGLIATGNQDLCEATDEALAGE